MKPYLTKLTAAGLKSGDFTHELDRVNLFVGRSASGKTARLEALRLALLGRVPDLGKLKSASLQLSRNGTIEVSISDSTGRYRWRRFSGEAKVQSSGDLPDAPEVLLDPNVYFGLSDEKKIEYAFGLIELDETECLQSVQEFGEPVKRIPGEPIQLWIKRAIETLKLELSAENKMADEFKKSVRANVALQGTPPSNPESELNAARTRQTELKVKREALLAEQAKMLEIDARLYQIAGELQLGEANRVEEIEANRLKLQEEINKLSVQTDSTDLEKATDRYNKLAEKKVKPSESYALKSHLEISERCLHDTDVKDKQFANDLHMLRRDMLAALQRALCPTCGGPLSKAKIESDFGSRIAKSEESRKQNQTERQKLIVEVKEWKAKLAKSQEADKKIASHQKDVATAKEELTETSKTFKQRETLRTSQLKTANDQLAAFNKALSETHAAAARREQLEIEKAKLEKQLEDRGNAVAVESEITGVESQLKTVALSIESLQKREREYATYRADEQRNAQTVTRTKEVNARIERIKQNVEAFEQVRARMIETAMGGILKIVNRFTQCVPGMKPVEYFNCEIGRRLETERGSTWIPHSTFSGTEKALTYAGISAALAKDAPIHIVMLDEMGRFDQETVIAVLQTMVELTTSDEIGQFIGCISWPLKAPNGVKMIEVFQ